MILKKIGMNEYDHGGAHRPASDAGSFLMLAAVPEVTDREEPAGGRASACPAA